MNDPLNSPTKFRVLDRPRSGDDLEARQHRWDEAVTELRFLEHNAWVARQRALARERKGSRRSRRLFEERVVQPAIARWTARVAAVRAEMQAVGEIVEVTLADFREDDKYDTIAIPGSYDRPDPRTAP